MHERRGRAAAFIDRDGVINVDTGHVFRIEDFRLLPGAVDGLLLLQQMGFALVVVTNQAGIGKGYYTEQQYLALTTHMRALLGASGVELLDVFHCPHHPEALIRAYRMVCECRKPGAGMLLRAAEQHALDLKASVLVGDKLSDIQAGRAVFVRACVLVTSGHPVSEGDAKVADSVQPGLLQAAQWFRATLPLTSGAGS